ncbi:MAG: protein BatD, partial [Sphingobacteriales bacterium]
MKCFFNMWRNGFLCLITLCLSLKAYAQTGVFSANASASRIGEQDQIQIDFTIQDIRNLKTFSPPVFKDFDVVDGSPFRSQSSNISVIGNRMVQVQTLTYSYVLRPRKTGVLTINPAVVKDADGRAYQSNGVKVEVVKGSLARRQPQNGQDPFGDDMEDPFVAMLRQRRLQQQQQQQQQAMRQPQSSQAAEPASQDISKDLFIKVAVDKSKAYVGEQITATYKLYARIPMNVSISKLPSLNGFWTQDFDRPGGNVRPTEEIVNGRKYQVFVLKKSALFPQQAGDLYLDPAEAEGTARVIQKVRQRNPLASMFEDDPVFRQLGSLMMTDPFFNDDVFSTMAYKDIPVRLKSSPVKISVQPLPVEGQPKDYGNAVGQFSVGGKLDRTKLTTDDAFTYTLTVTGNGNLKLIEAPSLKLPNGLTTYDPQISDTITGRSTVISGSKIISYSISANTPGEYEIPAVPFSYYDPKAGKYVTLSTNPVKVQVEKGRHYNPAVAKKVTVTDLHPIYTSPLEDEPQAMSPLFFKAGYWTMYALPLLAFIGLTFYKRREDALSKDTVKFRHRKANKIALKRLSSAQKLLVQNARQPFHDEVSKAIWLYLSDKLNIPLASLSRDRAFEALAARNVPGPVISKLDRTLTECETALY